MSRSVDGEPTTILVFAVGWIGVAVLLIRTVESVLS